MITNLVFLIRWSVLQEVRTWAASWFYPAPFLVCGGQLLLTSFLAFVDQIKTLFLTLEFSFWCCCFLFLNYYFGRNFEEVVQLIKVSICNKEITLCYPWQIIYQNWAAQGILCKYEMIPFLMAEQVFRGVLCLSYTIMLGNESSRNWIRCKCIHQNLHGTQTMYQHALIHPYPQVPTAQPSKSKGGNASVVLPL